MKIFLQIIIWLFLILLVSLVDVYLKINLSWIQRIHDLLWAGIGLNIYFIIKNIKE